MLTATSPCLNLDTLQKLTQQTANRDEVRRWASHIASCRHCAQTTAAIGAEKLVIRAVEDCLGKHEPLLAALKVELEGRLAAQQGHRNLAATPLPGTWTLAADGHGLQDAQFGTLLPSESERESFPPMADCTIADSPREGRLRRSPKVDRTLATSDTPDDIGCTLPTSSDEVAKEYRANAPAQFTMPAPTMPNRMRAVATMAAPAAHSPPTANDGMGRIGNYQLLKQLGAGAVGIVFLAEDVSLKRRVALKLLRPEDSENSLAKERFLREARAAAALEHENVVSVYQVGEEKGTPYLAMQLLQGETLDEKQQREQRLSMPEVVRIGRDIASGLAAAHERGLVHRDIKPANLWVEAGTQRVKILDFGLARGASEVSHLTRTGTVVGTPAYMSPEQARGTAVDHRTDLYSLGCVLYQMCAGVPPIYAEDTMSMLTALLTEQPRPLLSLNPHVPAPLVGLINSLLAKHPEGRPGSARDVVELLDHLRDLDEVSPVQHIESLSEDELEESQGSRWPMFALSTIFALGLGWFAWEFAPPSVTKPIKDLLTKWKQK